MELEFRDQQGDYRAEANRFVAETGATVTSTPSAAPVKLADPSSVLTIRIDPETLKLIFAYVAALGGGSFVVGLLKKFAESAAAKAGEKAGEKGVAALGRLWSDLWKRIDEIDRTGRHTRMYFTMTAPLGPVRFQAEALMTPLDLRSVSGPDLQWLKERAANAVVKDLLPIAAAFAEELGKRGKSPATIEARLHARVEPRGFCHWGFTVAGLGDFVLVPEGWIRPAHGKPGERWAPEEIPKIVDRSLETFLGRWRRRLRALFGPRRPQPA